MQFLSMLSEGLKSSNDFAPLSSDTVKRLEREVIEQVYFEGRTCGLKCYRIPFSIL